jgi:hypothetical protein
MSGNTEKTMGSQDANGQSLQVLTTLFQFDVRIQSNESMDIGKRVYVRFQHPSEAIAPRGIRALRRLFLRQFNV